MLTISSSLFFITAKFPVRVINPFEVAIGDTRKFGAYAGGGLMCQLHRRRQMQFRSLREEISSPTCAIVDYAKMSHPPQIVLCLLAYHRFQAEVRSVRRSNKNKEVKDELMFLHP